MKPCNRVRCLRATRRRGWRRRRGSWARWNLPVLLLGGIRWWPGRCRWSTWRVAHTIFQAWSDGNSSSVCFQDDSRVLLEQESSRADSTLTTDSISCWRAMWELSKSSSLRSLNNERIWSRAIPYPMAAFSYRAAFSSRPKMGLAAARTAAINVSPFQTTGPRSSNGPFPSFMRLMKTALAANAAVMLAALIPDVCTSKYSAPCPVFRRLDGEPFARLDAQLGNGVRAAFCQEGFVFRAVLGHDAVHVGGSSLVVVQLGVFPGNDDGGLRLKVRKGRQNRP